MLVPPSQLTMKPDVLFAQYWARVALTILVAHLRQIRMLVRSARLYGTSGARIGSQDVWVMTRCLPTRSYAVCALTLFLSRWLSS